MRVTGKTSEKGVVPFTKVLPCFFVTVKSERLEDGGGIGAAPAPQKDGRGGIVGMKIGHIYMGSCTHFLSRRRPDGDRHGQRAECWPIDIQ